MRRISRRSGVELVFASGIGELLAGKEKNRLEVRSSSCPVVLKGSRSSIDLRKRVDLWEILRECELAGGGDDLTGVRGLKTMGFLRQLAHEVILWVRKFVGEFWARP